MDGRGGCCIARYGGGGGYDMSTVDQIMLRYRPIAPKPATSSSPSPELNEVSSSRSSRGRKRSSNTNGKRCNNMNNNRKRKIITDDKADSTVVTLALLPETPDLLSPKQSKNMPTWLSFGGSNNNNDGNTNRPDLMWMPADHHHHTVVNNQMTRAVIGSCVTVECITDTWVDADGLGYTDEEKKINLERDTCPGFVSDGFGRVTWTNEAYKKMAGQGEELEGRLPSREVVVWLVMKDRVTVTATVGNNRAFTCRVRVQNERRSITVPCDVWRLESGGCAWRLDVKAALSLGW
ncbi:uncharacterized protein LOC126671693 [Mercurialis annua]|uniref:uncharacterized protein LOC126671693 n=1 Tax=Mercurialis annua TaxID=3986 RepID=UPI00215F1EAD|nr:uncharacterized protein LOC126671693 [Mercurialis annua]